MKIIQAIAAALIFGLAPQAFAQTTTQEFKAMTWDKSHMGTPLDLSPYKVTFDDDFNSLSVTADGGQGPWYAPIHTNIGATKLLPPGPNGPFTVKDGKLTIRSEKVDGIWYSSLMQTVDSKGHGFAQQYGYFEMSAEFPQGKGSWPSFWLKSQNEYLDKTKNRTEIDVVEWYGGDPKGIHSSVHLWPAAVKTAAPVLEKHAYRSNYYSLTSTHILVDGQLEGFHTYGVEVTPDWVISYFDRKEIGRFKTVPEYKTPLFMLVDLCMKDEADATSPKDLVVDYVKAYALK